MMTSSFKCCGLMPNAVGIAGRVPDWYLGKRYRDLAPRKWFFDEFKQDNNKELYTARYIDEVLNQLDARKVYEELGQDAILLCWEEPGEFCHRRLVARWLETNLGILVPEYTEPKPQMTTGFWESV